MPAAGEGQKKSPQFEPQAEIVCTISFTTNIMLMDVIQFKIKQAYYPGRNIATADEIAVTVKGNPRDVVRMLCLSMDKFEAVKISILSAALTYMEEHNLTIADLKSKQL